MNLKQFLAVPALFLILACGGGGGDSGTATFTYSTDWTGRSLPGGGVSQRVRLLTLGGSVLKNWIINYGTNVIDQVSAEVPAGDYLLQAQLYSQVDAGGVNTGVMNTRLTLSGASVLSTRVGETVTGIKVTPASVTVSLPGSQAFYAMPTGPDQTPCFAAPGSVTWATFGGIGTVDSDGLLLCNTAGSGSVRATHTPTTSIGSAAVTVNGSTPTTKKWTILVYLNAASDLYPYSTLNVNQMEAAASNPDVRIIVQWKQSQLMYPSSSFDGTRRYQIQPDDSTSVVSPIIQNLGNHVDMGSEATLLEFINWAKTYYPAERYGLIMWSHGNGWRRKPNDEITRAVSYDDETGNAIQIWEFLGGLGSNQMEFIAFDASLMQMMEVAYELRNNTKYVVGSEESPPGEGYPYTPIVAAFRDNPDNTTKNLTKAFVDAMVNEPTYTGRKITQSVVDTSKLGTLATKLDALAFTMISNAGTLSAAIQAARNNSQSYSQTSSPPRYYRDIVSLCENLEANTTNAAVDAASAEVRSALLSAVVWEGHNAQSPGSRGLSIDFTPGTVFLSSSTDYARMLFGIDTQWDDFLAISP